VTVFLIYFQLIFALFAFCFSVLYFLMYTRPEANWLAAARAVATRIVLLRLWCGNQERLRHY